MDKFEESKKRILTLIKLDSLHLFERIKLRKHEYLAVMAFKRTKEHFKDIFKSRYDTINFQELVQCEEELIIAIDHFYNGVDELKWYLFHTEDLPGTVNLKVDKALKEIESYYDTVCLYLSAQLDTLREKEQSAMSA